MKGLKNIINYLMILAGFIAITVSCSKEHYVEPIDKDEAPGAISQVRVEPMPGAAKISYKLPGDESLRYVKAVYEIRPGVEKESIASLYSNSLIVDGFPEEKEYEVKLYTVSYGEQVSANPVVVKFTPLTSPIQEAFNTFSFKEAFGGTSLTFENSGAANLSVQILTDSSGTLREVETYYTNAIVGQHSVRGFESQPRLFAAVIRDRWGNLSDTITKMLTPLFEEFIPKDLFQVVGLPTDTYLPHSTPTWNITQLWDGRTAPNGGIPIFHTVPTDGNMPQWFTFDMGRTALLSRYKLWHRGAQPSEPQPFAYRLGAPKKWEIWGTADTPDPSGSWDGWIKLMDSESYKPSGDGPITSTDLDYATNQGEDFTFPENTPPVRYIRFKTLETWGDVNYIYLQEISFWGDIQ